MLLGFSNVGILGDHEKISLYRRGIFCVFLEADDITN